VRLECQRLLEDNRRLRKKDDGGGEEGGNSVSASGTSADRRARLRLEKEVEHLRWQLGQVG